MSLFAELRRRNVFRVGAAYAVVAWVILQVTDLAAPALRLPEWVMSLVLFLLLLGFPIALFLAWAYELTPDGLRRAEDTADKETTTSPGGRYDIAIIALLLVAIGLIVHDNNFSGEKGVPEVAPEPVVETEPEAITRTVSIAVIPFINMSDNPEQEHFADGLTEELLNFLAPIEQLRVTSRTSSFAFKDSDLPLPEIAGKLGVDHILEGSVRRAGNRIRITAQLIETTTDSHLWSDTYDQELTVENIFEVQESIARKVINALQLRLLPAAQGAGLPANLDALDLYHDGLFISRQIETGQTWSDQDFRNAEAKYKAAIAADPEWVLPVAMLARLYHFWSGKGNPDLLAESRRLIDEVLERDPNNPVGLGSLGYILSVEGRFNESIDVYRRAKAAGAQTDWGMGIVLSSLGRFDEAVAAYRRALLGDPLNMSIRGQLTHTMQCAGLHRDVVREEDELTELFPDTPQLYELLARSHARLGNREKSLAYVDMLGDGPQSDAMVADVLALIGEEERARQAILDLGSEGHAAFSTASAAMILGDEDSGLEQLERLEEEIGAGFSTRLFCVPEFRALAGNPRYDALLERRGLLEQ